jgi:large subunit ribosomal protein L23
MNPYQIIRRPRITEKSVHLQNQLNSYTLEVHPGANKVQIKDAVKALWKVDVLSVNTVNCRGKERRVRSRLPGTTPAWKKAIVRLADGQKLEGV